MSPAERLHEARCFLAHGCKKKIKMDPVEGLDNIELYLRAFVCDGCFVASTRVGICALLRIRISSFLYQQWVREKRGVHELAHRVT